MRNLVISKPWGKYIILSQGFNYIVKKIIIEPNQQLSLQLHNNRSEHWTVINGECLVILGGDEPRLLKSNEHIYIPKKVKHRIINQSEDMAEILEIQYGLCDEEDIVRFEDNYGRVDTNI